MTVYWIRVVDENDECREIYRSSEDPNVPTYEGQEVWIGSGSYNFVETIRLHPFHSKLPVVTFRIPTFEFDKLAAMAEWTDKVPETDW